VNNLDGVLEEFDRVMVWTAQGDHLNDSLTPFQVTKTATLASGRSWDWTPSWLYHHPRCVRMLLSGNAQ
jgi:hypothetical protein